MNQKNDCHKGVAVIAGGSGYLGSCIVKALVEGGFAVVVIDKKIHQEESDKKISYREADIKNAEAMAGIAQEVGKLFGQINIIIQVATAPLIRKPLLDNSVAELTTQFDVNIFGSLNLFKNFCPLLADGGIIIGITSQAIESGSLPISCGSYLSAKLALRGLLRTLAFELRGRSIDVCAVAPAFMPGGLNSDIPTATLEFIKKKSKPENLTDSDQVTAAIMDLICGRFKNINGKSISIPGNFITDL